MGQKTIASLGRRFGCFRLFVSLQSIAWNASETVLVLIRCPSLMGMFLFAPFSQIRRQEAQAFRLGRNAVQTILFEKLEHHAKRY